MVEAMTTTAALTVDGTPACELELATGYLARTFGLMGRSGPVDGALLIKPTSSVHTFVMRFAIDVAFFDADMVVTDIVTMKPWRIGKPRRGAKGVIETNAGDLDRLGVRVGTRLGIQR